MTQTEKDKIIEKLKEAREDFSRNCLRRINEEYGKMAGANQMIQMIQRFLEVESEEQG